MNVTIPQNIIAKIEEMDNASFYDECEDFQFLDDIAEKWSQNDTRSIEYDRNCTLWDSMEN